MNRRLMLILVLALVGGTGASYMVLRIFLQAFAGRQYLNVLQQRRYARSFIGRSAWRDAAHQDIHAHSWSDESCQPHDLIHAHRGSPKSGGNDRSQTAARAGRRQAIGEDRLALINIGDRAAVHSCVQFR